MAFLLLTAWQPGLRKVALDRLLHQRAALGLREAHDCVSRLLAGEQVVIVMPDIQAAQAVAEEALALGAVARATETAPPAEALPIQNDVR